MVMATATPGFAEHRNYHQVTFTAASDVANIVSLTGRAATGFRVDLTTGEVLVLTINGTVHVLKPHEDRCDETIAVSATGIEVSLSSTSDQIFQIPGVPIEHLEATTVTNGPHVVTLYW
jgi:hypothetical protein